MYIWKEKDSSLLPTRCVLGFLNPTKSELLLPSMFHSAAKSLMTDIFYRYHRYWKGQESAILSFVRGKTEGCPVPFTSANAQFLSCLRVYEWLPAKDRVRKGWNSTNAYDMFFGEEPGSRRFAFRSAYRWHKQPWRMKAANGRLQKPWRGPKSLDRKEIIGDRDRNENLIPNEHSKKGQYRKSGSPFWKEEIEEYNKAAISAKKAEGMTGKQVAQLMWRLAIVVERWTPKNTKLSFVWKSIQIWCRISVIWRNWTGVAVKYTSNTISELPLWVSRVRCRLPFLDALTNRERHWGPFYWDEDFVELLKIVVCMILLWWCWVRWGPKWMEVIWEVL